MIARAIVAVLVGLVVAVAGFWAYQSFERVTEEEWTGASAAARANELLALERLLTRLGFAVRGAESLLELDRLPAGGVPGARCPRAGSTD